MKRLKINILMFLLSFILMISTNIKSQNISDDSLQNCLKIKRKLDIEKRIIEDSLKENKKALIKEKTRYFYSGNHSIFKINFTQLFINEISLYYERKIKNFYSIEFSAGILYPTYKEENPSTPSQFLRSNSFLFQEIVDVFNYKGATIRIMPKLYPNKNIYVAINLLYKYTYFNKIPIVIENYEFSGEKIQLRTDKLHVIGTSLFFGFQTLRLCKFYQEIFIGVGIRYKLGKEIIYDENGTGVYRDFQFNHTYPYTEKVSKIYTSFNLGIKFSIIMYEKENIK